MINNFELKTKKDIELFYEMIELLLNISKGLSSINKTFSVQDIKKGLDL